MNLNLLEYIAQLKELIVMELIELSNDSFDEIESIFSSYLSVCILEEEINKGNVPNHVLYEDGVELMDPEQTTNSCIDSMVDIDFSDVQSSSKYMSEFMSKLSEVKFGFYNLVADYHELSANYHSKEEVTDEVVDSMIQEKLALYNTDEFILSPHYDGFEQILSGHGLTYDEFLTYVGRPPRLYGGENVQEKVKAVI